MASEEELGEGLVELERASRVLEAERSRRLVEVERRGSWAVDGHLSVVSWLASRVRVGFGRASQQVKLSRALRAMPVTSRALGEAELSSEAVGLLVGARQAAPEAFGEAEPMLVDAAVSLPCEGAQGGDRLLVPGGGCSRSRGACQAPVGRPPSPRLPHHRGHGPDRRVFGPRVRTERAGGPRCHPGRLGQRWDPRPQECPSAPCRCPGGALQGMPRSLRQAPGGGRASPRGRDGGPAEPPGHVWEAFGARGHGSDHPGDRSAPGV